MLATDLAYHLVRKGVSILHLICLLCGVAGFNSASSYIYKGCFSRSSHYRRKSRIDGWGSKERNIRTKSSRFADNQVSYRSINLFCDLHYTIICYTVRHLIRPLKVSGITKTAWSSIKSLAGRVEGQFKNKSMIWRRFLNCEKSLVPIRHYERGFDELL